MARTVFITGASSGFGFALAHLYAKAGDRVALAARRKERLDALADELRNAGGTALALVCDVSDRTAVHEAVRQCEAELGPVDLLIANAGLSKRVKARAFDAEVMDKVIRINLMGTVYCIEAVIPGMVERGQGQLVAIGSLAGYRGLPGAAPYCASKAALISMMESLRIDLRKEGIAVTTICPGYVKTELTANTTHPKPFMMELDRAAPIIYRAIERKVSEYAFPWPLSGAVKFGRFLPNAIYDRLVTKMTA
jgi:short-subunit dehydrogenase